MSTQLEKITHLKKQFLQLVKMLAKSQGFYGRLLRDFEELTEEEQNEFLQQFKDCKTDLDIILKLEQ